MAIRPVAGDELAVVARWLADEQTDPTRHIAYLATDAAAIVEGLRGLEPNGPADALVAVDNGEVVGFLAAEHDAEPPRVWWHGPFVRADHDAATVADALHAAASERLPAHVTQQELGPDDRHAWLPAFAGRHGCVELVDRFACPAVNLTVRASNRTARRLYESLGFEEERLIRPWRRGFSLAHLDTPPSG